MKLVKALIRQSRIEDVIQALNDEGFQHLVLQEVRSAFGSCTECRGPSGDPSWMPVSEMQLSLLVDPIDVDAVTSIICTAACADDGAAAFDDRQGGYVCVSEVDQVLPIGRRSAASRSAQKVQP